MEAREYVNMENKRDLVKNVEEMESANMENKGINVYAVEERGSANMEKTSIIVKTVEVKESVNMENTKELVKNAKRPSDPEYQNKDFCFLELQIFKSFLTDFFSIDVIPLHSISSNYSSIHCRFMMKSYFMSHLWFVRKNLCSIVIPLDFLRLSEISSFL